MYRKKKRAKSANLYKSILKGLPPPILLFGLFSAVSNSWLCSTCSTRSSAAVTAAKHTTRLATAWKTQNSVTKFSLFSKTRIINTAFSFMFAIYYAARWVTAVRQTFPTAFIAAPIPPICIVSVINYIDRDSRVSPAHAQRAAVVLGAFSLSRRRFPRRGSQTQASAFVSRRAAAEKACKDSRIHAKSMWERK